MLYLKNLKNLCFIRKTSSLLLLLMFALAASACGNPTVTATQATRPPVAQTDCPADGAHATLVTAGQTVYTTTTIPTRPARLGEQPSAVPAKLLLFAFDVQTGKQRWVQDLNAQANASAVATDIQYYNNTVFISADALYAVDGTSGQVLWQQAGHGAAWHMNLCWGTVYQVGTDGFVTARQAKDGKLLWSTKVPNMTIETYIAFSKHGIYIDTGASERSGNTTLTALSLKDGSTLWQKSYSVNPFPGDLVALAADSQYVYVTHTGTIQLLNPATGQTMQTWTTDITAALNTIRGQTLFLFGPGYDATTIEAIDLHTGKQRWKNVNTYGQQTRNGTTSNQAERFIAIPNEQEIYANALFAPEKHFCALNGTTGKESWCVNDKDSPTIGIIGNDTLAVSDNAVIFLGYPAGQGDSAKFTLFALKKTDGSVLWQDANAV